MKKTKEFLKKMLPVWFIVLFVLLMVGFLIWLIIITVKIYSSSTTTTLSTSTPQTGTEFIPASAHASLPQFTITSLSIADPKSGVTAVTLQARTTVQFSIGTPIDSVFGFRIRVPENLVQPSTSDQNLHFLGNAAWSSALSTISVPAATLISVAQPIGAPSPSFDLRFRVSNALIPPAVTGLETYVCDYQITYQV